MLTKVFDIKKGDIITITGAGGKTSLMFSLARELSTLGRVLVTTTTKIFTPKIDEYEELILPNHKTKGLAKNIFIYGEKIENNKLHSLSYDKIFDLKKDFDYILIEASGVCEPLPIAQTITVLSEQTEQYGLPKICRLDNVVTVVDSLRLRDEFNCGNNLVKEY